MMGKVIQLKEHKRGPTQFQRDVKQLKAAGKLPTLDQLLEAVAETRAEYRSTIIAARRGK
jgi:hypothetical protein